MLFAGFFVNFNTLQDWLKPLCYGSYLRYVFEGIMLAVYGRIDGKDRKFLHCGATIDEELCAMKNPKDLLIERNMENATYMVNVWVLLGIYLSFCFLIYWLLRFKMFTLH